MAIAHSESLTSKSIKSSGYMLSWLKSTFLFNFIRPLLEFKKSSTFNTSMDISHKVLLKCNLLQHFLYQYQILGVCRSMTFISNQPWLTIRRIWYSNKSALLFSLTFIFMFIKHIKSSLWNSIFLSAVWLIKRDKGG